MPSRRTFLHDLVTSAPAALLVNKLMAAGPQDNAPWSAGTEKPTIALPADATDCHHHIYNVQYPRVSASAAWPGSASVADYRLLQQRLGISRHVVVQPAAYAFDNRCLMDSLQQFGSAARGIAVVGPDVSTSELRVLDSAGVRGIRLTLARTSVTSREMASTLAAKIAPFGWHIQVNGEQTLLLDGMATWKNLPVPVVFDHMAHVPSITSPLYSAVAALLQQGQAWVKLSGLYLDSKSGPPAYADRAAVAQAFIKEAPQRVVWGTDWPHPSVKVLPDDAQLVDLLAAWTSSPSVERQILVDNPALLYRFS